MEIQKSRVTKKFSLNAFITTLSQVYQVNLKFIELILWLIRSKYSNW